MIVSIVDIKSDIIHRSGSLYRSAAALFALVRLSISLYGDFYVAIAAVEPIFHLETLVNALHDSNPEKGYFLILLGLARARYAVSLDTEVTEELALGFRLKLLKILNSNWCAPLP